MRLPITMCLPIPMRLHIVSLYIMCLSDVRLNGARLSGVRLQTTAPTKTLSRLQAALLERDFIIQYKKGSSCSQTTCHRSHSAIQTSLHPWSTLLILFKRILLTFRKQTPTCNTWTNSKRQVHGPKICQNLTQTMYRTWLLNYTRMQAK